MNLKQLNEGGYEIRQGGSVVGYIYSDRDGGESTFKEYWLVITGNPETGEAVFDPPDEEDDSFEVVRLADNTYTDVTDFFDQEVHNSTHDVDYYRHDVDKRTPPPPPV